MSAHGARRLAAMAENAVERDRASSSLPPRRAATSTRRSHRARRSKRVRARLRERVPRLDHDRYLAPDIAAAADLVRSGALAAAADAGPPGHRRTECMTEPWLTVKQGDAPLLVSFPHTGLSIPAECAAALVSFPLARHDADRHIDKLYAFATELGATTVHTALSRTVIDVNRDPSGASLYPGQTTTGLVPTETFDGRALYRDGAGSPRRTRSSGARRFISRRIIAHSPGDQAAARPASARGAVRLPLHPFGRAAAVFRRTAGVQHRHQCRQELRSRPGSGGGAPLRREPVVACGQRTVHRRLDHPHLWPPCRRRPCRADGARDARLSPNENDPPPWDPDFAKPIQQTLRAVLEDCLAFARG